jgi:hypothetical protein
MRRREVSAAVAALSVALATGNGARGQGFDLDSFKPAATGTGYLCEESTRLLPVGTLDLGLTLGYAYRPLVLRDQRNGAIAGDIVTYRSSAYLTAAYGLHERVDVGARLPVVLAQAGDVAVDLMGNGGVPRHPATHALGDLDLLARVRLRAPADGRGFRLTLTVPLGLPIGDTDGLVGTGSVSLRPRMIAGWEGARLSTSISAGYELRQKTEVPGSTFVVGQAIGAGAGLAYLAVAHKVAFLDTLTVLAEASIAVGLAQPETGSAAIPAQGLVGLRTKLPWGLLVQVAGGTGLNGSVGSPRMRALITVARIWDPAPRPAAPKP